MTKQEQLRQLLRSMAINPSLLAQFISEGLRLKKRNKKPNTFDEKSEAFKSELKLIQAEQLKIILELP